MNTLKLETFLSSDTDWEKNQYAVLGGLKEYRTNFYRKQLYPALSELISLLSILEDVLNHKKTLAGSFPKEITEYDIKNKKIIYQALERLSPDVEFLFELIEWALPKIKEVIEEGAVLFDYVEKNLKVQQVGLIPLYKSEGYFIVPDISESVLKVMRFECSMFFTGKQPFRALKTRVIESIQMSGLNNNPESIKLDLISKYRDLPNPATFLCVTELDFPFSETLFPVAKRKLLSNIAVS
jgi:hypothetical protein